MHVQVTLAIAMCMGEDMTISIDVLAFRLVSVEAQARSRSLGMAARSAR
jgi:hypothetical protein